MARNPSLSQAPVDEADILTTLDDPPNNPKSRLPGTISMRGHRTFPKESKISYSEFSTSGASRYLSAASIVSRIVMSPCSDMTMGAFILKPVRPVFIRGLCLPRSVTTYPLARRRVAIGVGATTPMIVRQFSKSIACTITPRRDSEVPANRKFGASLVANVVDSNTCSGCGLIT